LIVHPVVIIFETHDTTFKWSILIDSLLDLRVHKDFRYHWLRRLPWGATEIVTIR
jgi:hypothetical protein